MLPSGSLEKYHIFGDDEKSDVARRKRRKGGVWSVLLVLQSSLSLLPYHIIPQYLNKLSRLEELSMIDKVMNVVAVFLFFQKPAGVQAAGPFSPALWNSHVSRTFRRANLKPF